VVVKDSFSAIYFLFVEQLTMLVLGILILNSILLANYS